VSDGEKVQLSCPKCGQRIAAPANRGGARAKCPNCQTVFTLPGPRTDAPSPPRRYDGLPPFPIIRVYRAWLWYDVVAIYEKHLVCGKRFLLPPNITEEMCAPSGEAALKKILFRPRSIFFSDITEFREDGIIALPSAGNRANSFSIVGKKKERLRFSVQASQLKTPRSYFATMLGDRYWLAKGSWLSRYFLVRLFLICGVLALLFGFTSFIYRYPVLALLGVAPGAALCGLGSWLQFGKKRPEKKQFNKYPSSEVTPLRSKTSDASARPPFRAVWLGLPLKLLGVAYLIVIASPLTNGLGPIVFQHFHHANTIIYSIWGLVWLPAPLLILAGYRLCVRQRERLNSADARKPIVILRPFEMDPAISLQPAGPLAWLMGIRSRWLMPPDPKPKPKKRRWHFPLWDLLMLNHPVKLFRMLLDFYVKPAEESLVNYFRRLGPVLAIGKSGNPTTPEKERKYSDYSQWQNTVRSQLAHAQGVVVLPGAPAGVRWELEQVHASVDPSRVLLCPAADWQNPQAYEELSMFARNILEANLPRALPFRKRPVFILFDENWKPRVHELNYKFQLLWPFMSDAASLRRSLKPFVKGWEGKKLPVTRRPNWLRATLNWSGTALALAFALALICLPFFGADSTAEAIIDPEFSATVASAITFDDDKEPAPFTAMASDDPQVQEATSNAAKQLAAQNHKTLKGKSVSYEFEIPETMIEVPGDNDLMEFSRESPDGRLRLQVVAAAGKEDLNSLPELRLSQNNVLGKSEARLESTQKIREGNVTWTEARVLAKSKDGIVREISRGTSGDYGTIIVIISLNNSAETDPTYQTIVDDILKSFNVTH
jgi:hypothetical protein